MKRYLILMILSFVALQGIGQKKTYEYDDLNRLSKSHYWEGSNIKASVTYTYDQVGNRLSKAMAVICDGMYTVASGNWNDPTIWSCARIPFVTDNVTITTGHTINVPSGVFPVKNITIIGTISYSVGGELKLNP